MRTDINTILQGFAKYLEKENSEKYGKYYIDASNSTISIFAHLTEFKKYISQELNIFSQIQSMSINEILSMEVEDGKLVVDDKENKNDENDVDGNENNSNSAQSLLDILEDERNLNNENKSDEQASEQIEEIKDEKLINLNEEETRQTSEAEQEAVLLDSEIINDKTDDEQDNLLIDILNNILQDKNIINGFDDDKDGSLNKDEVAAFLNLINEADEDLEEFSLDDIFFGVDEFKTENKINEDNDSDLEEGKTILSKDDIKDEDEVEIKDNKDDISSPSISSSHASSNASYGSSGGNSSAGSYNTSTSNTSTNTANEKSLENMTKEQLDQELSLAQSQAKKEQDILISIFDGTNEQLKQKNENTQNLYSKYLEELEKVDVDMAKKVDTVKQDIDLKQAEIDAKDLEIVNQENEVHNCEMAYTTAQANKAQLQASLDSLNSADVSNLSDSESNDLQDKKAELQIKLNQAIEAEKNAKIKLEESKKTLEELNSQKQTFQDELETLNEQKTELETEISERYPQVQELLDEYNMAQKEQNEYKASLVNSTKGNITQAQNREKEVNVAIDKLNNKEVQKEYSLSPINMYNEQEGKRLVEVANQMLQRYGSTTGLCATGVSNTINMAYGIRMGGNGCDWDTNMEKLVEKGLFVEVTQEYPNADSLLELKAGSVVCWEATGVQDGSGGQYGHVTIADGNQNEISDHRQKIIRSVGGRSDTYRVFIPV